MTNIIDRLDQISNRYEAVFCDLWGCLHNGLRPFDSAVRALEQYRDSGGHILLLTNAPRSSASVQAQLDAIGVSRDLYHCIVSSGDAARAAMVSGAYGKKVFHIGAPRDEDFFHGLEDEDFYCGIDIERVALDQAESIICTGLHDDTTETPADYTEVLQAARARALPLLCANPDIFVDRGDHRIYCAGALAAAYTDMGGISHYVGKPHAPIYQLARNRLTAVSGRIIEDRKILCIGDGIRTDIQGAIAEDLDSLFISGGLALADTMDNGKIQQDRLNAFFAAAQLTPTYSIDHLR